MRERKKVRRMLLVLFLCAFLCGSLAACKADPSSGAAATQDTGTEETETLTEEDSGETGEASEETGETRGADETEEASFDGTGVDDFVLKQQTEAGVPFVEYSGELYAQPDDTPMKAAQFAQYMVTPADSPCDLTLFTNLIYDGTDCAFPLSLSVITADGWNVVSEEEDGVHFENSKYAHLSLTLAGRDGVTLSDLEKSGAYFIDLSMGGDNLASPLSIDGVGIGSLITDASSRFGKPNDCSYDADTAERGEYIYHAEGKIDGVSRSMDVTFLFTFAGEIYGISLCCY